MKLLSFFLFLLGGGGEKRRRAGVLSRQDQRTCRSREGVVGVDVGDGEHDGNSDDGEAQRAVGADADGPRPINVHSSCPSLHSHAQSAQWGSLDPIVSLKPSSPSTQNRLAFNQMLHRWKKYGKQLA